MTIVPNTGTPIPSQGPVPRTRYGGAVTLGGREFATAAELEEELTAAVQAAGTYRVTLTEKGRQLAAALAAEAGR